MKRITSRDNAAFKALKKLAQSGRERRQSRRIVLDGMHLIEGYRERFGLPDEILVSEIGLRRAEIARFVETHPELAIVALTDTLFSELATVDTPSGIMAVANLPSNERILDPMADAVLLDGIQDPGNLGSILRSAAAAGFRQVLLSFDCAQAWSPKTLRAAMGAHCQLDLLENHDLIESLSTYRGESIVTALDTADDLFSTRLDATVAWIFGSEGQGVRPALAARAKRRVCIPMPGGAESLNVGAAAAVCLFETVRQRRLS